MIELTTHGRIQDVGEALWSELTRDAPPFCSFPWLSALERTGCVRPERGWLPLHLVLRESGRVVAAAAAYVKGNSEGEFVFDHAWASFAESRLRVAYYPKLVVAIPFTPATGRRLHLAVGEDPPRIRQAFAQGLRALCADAGLSSAHVLFSAEDEARALAGADLAHRHGVQFHWRNAGYESFEDFLGRFNSKRRNQIRRELRAPREQGTSIEVLSGKSLTEEAIEAMFEFYLATVNKYFYGRQYLNRRFFFDVAETMGERVMIVLARDAGTKRPIAGALNLIGREALFGRYWGTTEERPHLHFNVCYYAGVAECITRGLARFEPGAGGEHKVARGFEPTVTHSLHHLHDERLDRAVRDHVGREREAIADHLRDCGSPLKPVVL